MSGPVAESINGVDGLDALDQVHPYYAIVDAAKRLHINMMRKACPDSSFPSVLMLENEDQIRSTWGGPVRPRLLLRQAIAKVSQRMLLDLDNAGGEGEGEEPKTKTYALVKQADEGGGEFADCTIIAQIVPVGFTPSTARAAAQELREAFAKKKELPVEKVNVLYADLQTLDRALLGETTNPDPSDENYGQFEIVYDMLFSASDETGMVSRPNVRPEAFPIRLPPAGTGDEQLVWYEVAE